MRVTVVRTIAALATVSLLACSEPTVPDQSTDISILAQQTEHGTVLYIEGAGAVNLSAAGADDASFMFVAKQNSDGTVRGVFAQRRMRNGLAVNFAGTVTCLAFDATLRRVRIGGVITQNNSTDPAFLTENHEVGDDVWFRIQDGIDGTDVVDASTTYGFKPTLVNTSAEYCALPFTGLPAWNPASIFPLRSGSILVRP